jgi:NAD(P)-dependent dehydrogenase (short-subunit alcohol dehydrogenase family)
MRQTDLKDAVAVITGGSRGIGREIALLLAGNGAQVVICARGYDDLQQTAEVVRGKGGKCEYVAVDITEKTQVDALAALVLGKHGKVDILVNNAGVGVCKPFLDSTPREWDRVIDTNLKGVFLCSQAFASAMAERKKGIIINIASGAGKTGMENLSIYCASKFGLIGMTESMKKELGLFGIEVAYICPGFVRTGFFRDFPADFRLPPNALKPEAVAVQVLRLITRRDTWRGKIGSLANRLAS